MEQKERKIGERFKDSNTLLETVKCEFCEGCFYCNNGCSNSEIQGPCGEFERTDEECVIFKEIKDMKEENQNKEEHFYIWGVPNRGEEIKKLLSNKGVIPNFTNEAYSKNDLCFYYDNGEGDKFLNKIYSPSLCNLITSNWTELKLPYKPKDKELVWMWNKEDIASRCLKFYDAIHKSSFRHDGNRNGCKYDNLAPFEGECPQWAKDALSKLED